MFYVPEHDVTYRIGRFMHAVYGFMAAALGLSALIAYFISANPALTNRLFNSSQSSMILIGLCVAQVILVIVISASIRALSFSAALGLFFLYAALLGVSLSSIFLVYNIGSIYQTFFIAAAMFGSMSLYGYFTNADLTLVGNIGIMIVWGLCISMFINIWFKSAQFDMIISMVGVIVFALLTAYDTQKIKLMGRQMLLNENDAVSKVAVLGALILYLDFINIFLFLLRFLGDRKK